LEGIRIARKGFPNRLVYADFLKRYYLLVPGVPRKAADPRKAVQAIIEKLEQMKVITDKDQYRFGISKIFFRAGILGNIEEAREKKISEFVPIVQAAARGYVARKMLKKMHEKKIAVAVLQRNIRAWLEFKNWAWFKLFTKARPLLKRRNFEKEIEERQALIDKLQKDLAAEQANKDSLSKQVAELQANYDKTAADLKSTRSKAADLEGTADDLSKERERLASELAQLKKDLDDKADSLEESDKSKESLQSRLKALEKGMRSHNQPLLHWSNLVICLQTSTASKLRLTS